MSQTLSPLFGDYLNDSFAARAAFNQPGIVVQPRITHTSTGSGDGKAWTVYLQPNVDLGVWAWRTAWDTAKGSYTITEDASTTILTSETVPPTGQFRRFLVVGRWKWVAGEVDGGGHPLGTFGAEQMAEYEIVEGTDSATPSDPAVDAVDVDGRKAVILARITLSHADNPVLEFFDDTMLDLRSMGISLGGKMNSSGDTTHSGGFLRSTQAPADDQDVVRKGDIEDWSVAAPANIAHFTFSSALEGTAYTDTATPPDPSWALKLGSGYNVDYQATPSFKAHQTGVFKLTLNLWGTTVIAAGLTYMHAWVAVKRAGGTYFTDLIDWASSAYTDGPNNPEISMTIPMALSIDDEVGIFYLNPDCSGTSGRATFEYLGRLGANGTFAITNGDVTYSEPETPSYPRTVSITLTSENATGGVTWSLDAGTDAPDATVTGNTLEITFDGGSTIGIYTVNLHAVDGEGFIATKSISVELTAYAAASLEITTGDKSFICSAGDLPYSVAFTVAATGGTAPYTWALIAGADTNLTSAAINASTGAVTGTMSSAGTKKVKAEATDSAGSPAVVSKVINITLATFPDGGGEGCVPAGTMFATLAGPVPIETVGIGTQVRAYDDNTGEHVITTVTEVFTYGDRALVKLITPMGALICSLDHRVMLFGGSPVFKRASEVIIGESLAWETAPGFVAGATVTGIEFLPGTTTVYHVHLASGHVYIAGNVLAHNYKPV